MENINSIGSETEKCEKDNYMGSIVANDLAQLHRPLKSRVYFEELKSFLKRNQFEYEIFKKSRAQILDVSKDNNTKIRIYYTGGMGWWGFYKGAINKMLEAEPKCPCYLLIFADAKEKKERNYWWRPISAKDTNDVQLEHWQFSEPNKGKLQLPQGLEDKKHEADSDLRNILTKMMNL